MHRKFIVLDRGRLTYRLFPSDNRRGHCGLRLDSCRMDNRGRRRVRLIQIEFQFKIIIGYSFRPNSEANVEVGSAKFPMYTQNDGAWIKNAAEETRLIEAMRKGSDLVVRGTSARGTDTIDRYSLKGLAQALDRAAQECK